MCWKQTSRPESICLFFTKRGFQPTPITTKVSPCLTALDFTKNQWLGCETLSDKILIYKVVISIALSSGSRASAIHHPSLKFCEYA